MNQGITFGKLWRRETIIGQAVARFLPPLVAIGLVAATVLGGRWQWASEANRRPAILAPPMSVSVFPATLQSGFEWSREFLGRVEARRASGIGFEIGGKLQRVLVDEGDAVDAAQPIASLDTQLTMSQRNAVAAHLAAASARLGELIAGPREEVIQAAEAEVSRWEAEAQLIARTNERLQKLVRSSAVSQQEVDESSFGLLATDAQLQAARARLLELRRGTRKEQTDSQRALVDQLRSELETIDITLAKSTLHAPFAGVVSHRYFDEGTVIEAGSPVVEILETGDVDVRVGVDREMVSQLSEGETHEVRIAGKPFQSKLRAIRPDRNASTRTVSVLLAVTASDRRIQVGDTATLKIKTWREGQGHWLPLAALTESHRGLWGAYVASPHSESLGQWVLQRRELEILHQETDRVFVRGSLRPDDQVVASGLHRLVPGQQVVVQRADSDSLPRLAGLAR